MIKDGITISRDSGSGNMSVTISADPNEGLDVSVPIRVTDSNGSYRDITINREGRREVFVSDFICKDGDTFNVIKEQNKNG